MRKSSNNPTLKTVAAASGFAVTTVSKALANDHKISKSTRDHVNQIAAELGYIPNRAAQRLRTGKTKVISLVLDSHDELLGFGNALIAGITRALESSGFHLVVTPDFMGIGTQGPVEHIVHNHLADGIIFSRTSPFDERVRFLMENDFPFVTHGRTNFGTAHSFVDFDNEKFAEMAVEKLASMGAKKVCIILPPESLTFNQHLKSGTIRAANRLGVDYVFAKGVTLDSPLSEINAWAAQIARSNDRPDAYIFAGEASYFAVLNAFQKAGLTRIKDFNVVVKRNSELICQIDDGVDVIFEDITKAGQKLGEFIIDQIETKQSVPLQFIDVP